MSAWPRGTVTFLFTDVEGSTRLWQAHPAAMERAYLQHDAILRGEIERHGGVLYKTIGDAIQAAFPTATAALAAALAAQTQLHALPWTDLGLPEPLRVRMALHAGHAEPLPDGDYRTPLLNRAGRLLGAAHGGQVLLSQVVVDLSTDALPDGAALLALGPQRFKDLGRPEPVWQLTHPALPARFPPLATMAQTPNNLPAQPSLLVGRERELATVATLLAQPGVRLVSLTGPGGVGKTRLALQAAAEGLERYLDGVWFVDLAALTDPALVPAAIADVLGVPPAGGQPPEARLAAYLRERRLLLVLDNLEQITDAAPHLAALLAAAPGLQLLVTSRIRLQLRAEHEVVVAPLDLPDPERPPPPDRLLDYPAVRLFVERAQAARPGLSLDAATAPVIARICHHLDGLPLAIELAAARSKLFAPEQLLTRLERRLPMLTGGARDLPARQRTLRDAIAWSYDLLAPQEQTLFRRLAVFAGGFTLAGGEWLADGAEYGIAGNNMPLSAIDGIAALVDQSLLRQDEAADSGEPRFRMLETVREFALERLQASGEEAEVRRRHADYVLTVAESAETGISAATEAGWLVQMDAEHDNLRAALHWTSAHAPLTALRLATACWKLWLVRGHFAEGRSWLEQVRDLPLPAAETAALRAKALSGEGVLAYRQGDHTAAIALQEASLALYRELGDRAGVANSLNNLGVVANDQRDDARATAYHEESLALRRALGDRPGIASSLNNLGAVAFRRGDLARAEALYRESLALRRELDDRPGIASCLNNLGGMAGSRRAFAQAAALFEESLALYRELGDRASTALLLTNLGSAVHELGDLERAAALCGEGLLVRREMGNRRAIAYSLEVLAAIARETARPVPAVRLLGAAAALRAASGAALFPGEQEAQERQIAELRTGLGEERFATALAAGRALSLDAAVAEALRLVEAIGGTPPARESP